MGWVRGCAVKSPHCFSRGPKGGSRTHARPVTAAQGIRHLALASLVQYPHTQIIKWIKLLKTQISHCCLPLHFPDHQWRLGLGPFSFQFSLPPCSTSANFTPDRLRWVTTSGLAQTPWKQKTKNFGSSWHLAVCPIARHGTRLLKSSPSLLDTPL